VAWNTELKALVKRTWPVGTTFTLTQVYEFENELAALHPANQNVRDTVIAAPHASSRRRRFAFRRPQRGPRAPEPLDSPPD
jgi:DpnI-like restriction endonuclease